MSKTILILTRSFPFVSLETYFIQNEIHYINKEFDKVILIPSLITEKLHSIDNTIILERSLASLITKIKKEKKVFILKGLFSSLFYREILKNPRIVFFPRHLYRLLNSIHSISYTKKWLSLYLINNQLTDENIIIYTYWFTELTTACGLFAKHHNNIRIVTRSHGADLYEERNNGYIPLRKQTLKLIDKQFFISTHGLNYANNLFPEFSSKYCTANLGVPDPLCNNQHSYDQKFRIVSCSSMIKLKRIELLFEGLSTFSTKYKNISIIWTHFGGGPLYNSIKTLTEVNSPINLECNLLGYVPNNEILDFYKRIPIDIFINVSESEGKPVTLMEVQSFGIPAIASNVGGVSEIVNNENGIILSSNPSCHEISKALELLYFNQELSSMKRVSSKQNWQLNYNSDTNYRSFAVKLSNLIAK